MSVYWCVQSPGVIFYGAYLYGGRYSVSALWEVIPACTNMYIPFSTLT